MHYIKRLFLKMILTNLTLCGLNLKAAIAAFKIHVKVKLLRLAIYL